MKKLIPILFVLHAASATAASNFATCLLDKLPGLQNDAAAHAAVQFCAAEFPGGMPSVKQGSGRGFFGYDSGAECTMKKSGSTPSLRAGMMISTACRKLYDEPINWDDYELVEPAQVSR